MRKRNNIRQGLTLLEVLLALTIIGMGVAVLSTATSRCLALVTRSDVFHKAKFAMDLAQLKYPIVEVEGELKNKEVSDTEVVPGFVFSRTSESPEDYDETGLYLLHDRIVWEGTGSNNFEEMLRYLYYTNDLADGDMSD